MVLVITAVPAALDRLELGKFLLPITQNMWLHPAQLTDLTDGEVAFGWYGWQLGFAFTAATQIVAALHRSSSPPSPSASGWREM